MSAPVAGKFQDHYQVLGVEPKSDSETIQRAYAKLAQKYHPDNRETGNRESFDAVNLAYEVLANPVTRREFDALKGIGANEGPPKFSGAEFFDAFGRDAGLRAALMCILYDRRRTKPFTPSLSLRHVEGLLDATTEELNFALWYLKQRMLVGMDDKSSLYITVDGMDSLAASRPSPELIMPFIKTATAAVSAPEPEAKAAEPVSPTAEQMPAPAAKTADEHESMRNVMVRVMARR